MFQFQKLHYLLQLSQLLLLLPLMLLHFNFDSFRLQFELQLELFWNNFLKTVVSLDYFWNSLTQLIVCQILELHRWTFEFQLNSGFSFLHSHNWQIPLLQWLLVEYREVRHHGLTKMTWLTLSPTLKHPLTARNVPFMMELWMRFSLSALWSILLFIVHTFVVR